MNKIKRIARDPIHCGLMQVITKIFAEILFSYFFIKIAFHNKNVYCFILYITEIFSYTNAPKNIWCRNLGYIFYFFYKSHLSLSYKIFFIIKNDWPLSLYPFVVSRYDPYPLHRQSMAVYPRALVALSLILFLPYAQSMTKNYLYALAIHPCPVFLMSFAADIPHRFLPKNSTRNRDTFRDRFRWHVKYLYISLAIIDNGENRNASIPYFTSDFIFIYSKFDTKRLRYMKIRIDELNYNALLSKKKIFNRKIFK